MILCIESVALKVKSKTFKRACKYFILKVDPMCSPRKAEVKNEQLNQMQNKDRAHSLPAVTPSGEEPRGFYLQGENINIVFETF